MSTENNPELESFRQQWRAEVTAKHHIGESSRHQPSSTASTSAKRRPSHIAKPRPHNLHRPIDGHESSEDENEQHNKLEKIRSHGSNTSATGDRYDIDHFAKTITKEPETALEHYEKAVEREASGSLGESLDHYRKAFRAGTPLGLD
jgi:F-box protein 9